MKITNNVKNLYETLYEMGEFFEEQAEKKQDKYDNASEEWQEGENGEECLDAINSLEEISSDCDTLISSIENLYEL